MDPDAIKRATEKLKEQVMNHQRQKMSDYLKDGPIVLLRNTRQIPPVVRSIQDICNRTLPRYKDQTTLDLALEAMDFEKIYSRLDIKEKQQSETGNLVDKEGNKFDYTDFLVQELLRWYKEDFFTWVNTPKCTTCDSDSNVRMTGRANEMLLGEMTMVELYKCQRCNTSIRFPRYNNLLKLLEWRQGRCGEWNNCFLLLLNACGIKARYLWNLEDHVWCEYYSTALKRWIHLDSCENSFDEPLLYNNGWGKKMSYVIAIGEDYAIDVTEKYVVKDKLPRNQVSEADLQKFINIHNFSRWLIKDDQQLYNILVDYNNELKKLKPTLTKTQGLKPRQSGNEAWTQSRGENGV